MKRTDLEKLKAKKLGSRLMRERAAHQGAGTERGEEPAATRPASELVGKLLRKIIEKK